MRYLIALLCSVPLGWPALAVPLPAQGPPPQPGGQPEQRAPMLLPQVVVLPRGDAKLSIDGTLTDWPGLPAVRLDDSRQLSGTGLKAWNGPRDTSAMVFFLWDEKALYFAAAVRDEWHRPLERSCPGLLVPQLPSESAQMWQGRSPTCRTLWL